MIEPIYSSEEHRTIIETYLMMCREFSKDVSTKSRYNNYLDVIDTVIEYHNEYGTKAKGNNFYDWLMIIPINLSVATNGFLAGVETKGNSTIIRSYRVILEELVHEVANNIDNLKVEYE
jgi:hypothetical protein